MSVVALRPVLGWSGRIKACLGCGGRHLPEMVSGLCVDCFEREYGPLGLAGPVGGEECEPVSSVVSTTPVAPAVVALPEPIDWPMPFVAEAPPVPLSAAGAPPLTPTKRWATNYDACIQCGTTESQHHTRGLCKKCGMREYNARKAAGKVGSSRKTAPAAAVAIAPPAPAAIVARDLSAIPLSDLLAEVQRRASALEEDAAKFRQIRAVIG
jgi:hypothetical protein